MSLAHTARLSFVHARFQLIDLLRSPASVGLGLGMPVVAFAFFIVPQRSIADNPVFATSAMVALVVFGVMANSLFGFALEISQTRERTWGAYLKGLPGPFASRMAGYAMSTGILALLSAVPVVLLALVATAAHIASERWWIFVAVVVATAAPFMFLSMVIGHLMSSRTSIAVVQVLMLGLAFGGGLFLPPAAFPPWLDVVSTFLPTRHALDLSIWAAEGGGFPVADALGWGVWTFATAAAALAAARWDRTHREG